MKQAQLEHALTVAKANNLGLTSLEALLLVNKVGVYQLSNLAMACGVSTAAMTGQADKLESLGYAKRAHSSKDRRSILLEITAEGRALINKILNA